MAIVVLASRFTPADLEGLPLNELQLVQVLVAYDQRLLDDGISTLRSHGIAVHARSLYLQGLLVTPPERWSEVIAPALRHHHEKLQSWAQSNGWSLVQLALTWARRQAWMEAAVVGVTSETELDQLRGAWCGPDPWQDQQPESWAWPLVQILTRAVG